MWRHHGGLFDGKALFMIASHKWPSYVLAAWLGNRWVRMRKSLCWWWLGVAKIHMVLYSFPLLDWHKISYLFLKDDWNLRGWSSFSFHRVLEFNFLSHTQTVSDLKMVASSLSLKYFWSLGIDATSCLRFWNLPSCGKLRQVPSPLLRLPLLLVQIHIKKSQTHMF